MAPNPFPAPELELSRVSVDGNAWDVYLNMWVNDLPDGWNDGNSPLTQFHIYRRDYGSQEWQLLDSPRAQSPVNVLYTDRELPEGTYEYAISSTNQAGFESELSEASTIGVGPLWVRQDIHAFLDRTEYWTPHPVVVLDMFFVNDNNGYALLKEIASGVSASWRMPAVDGSLDRIEFRVLMRTLDGGITWEPVSRMPAIQSLALTHFDAGWQWLHFSNLSNGLAIGNRFDPPVEWTINVTQNGGQTFSPLEQRYGPNNEILSDIDWNYRPENIRRDVRERYLSAGYFGDNIFIAGLDGTLLRRLAGGNFQNIALRDLDVPF